MMKKKRVLFVSQEMTPFVRESEISTLSNELALGIMSTNEIRNFMPKYGLINERRHQLHEVIRLSGINLIVNNSDYPLIMKVASIQPSRMQVYFVENEEFFKRKAFYGDENTPFFTDNDERTIFYSKGIVETVKKLGWAPDIVVCSGWMCGLLPLYLKTIFKNEPLLSNAKIVTILYNMNLNDSFTPDFAKKIASDDISKSNLKILEQPTVKNLYKLAANHSEALAIGTPNPEKDLKEIVEQSGLPVWNFEEDAEKRVSSFLNFLEEVLEGSEILTE